MSKRPTDNYEPSAKKRCSSRQLTKDDPSDDEEEEERGSMTLASEEVLKTRKVVRVRRNRTAPATTSDTNTATPANPFAGVSLFKKEETAAVPSPVTDNQETPTPDTAHTSPENTTSVATAPVSSSPTSLPPAEGKLPEAVVQDSSPISSVVQKTSPTPSSAPSNVQSNVDTQTTKVSSSPNKAAGFGSEQPNGFAKFASETSLSGGFGAISKDGEKTPTGFGAIGGSGTSLFGSFNSGASDKPFGGNGFSFSSTGAGNGRPSTVFGGQTLFASNSTTEDTASIAPGNQSSDQLLPATETVTGEFRVNCSKDRPTRFVMRQRGNQRLLMNGNLWTNMMLTRMEGGRGVTFAIRNAASMKNIDVDPANHEVQTYALRLRTSGDLDKFLEVVEKHKVSKLSEV